MRRILLLFGILVVALVIAGALVFRSVSGSGSSPIESWIGEQLQLIANSYLNPQLSFTHLDYQYPGTVSLRDFRLRAQDPNNPGHPIDILAAESAVLTLAEIPSKGNPIVIEKIILKKPLFSAVSESAEHRRLIGFSNLTKGSPAQLVREQAPSTMPTTRPRLSNYFNIRLIQITDGRIVYDPRIPDTEPMELDQINTTLNVEPSESGWYGLDTSFSRKPIFDMALAGQINIDTFDAREFKLKLIARLDQENLSYLPPQLQQWVKKYELAGSLDVQAGGEFPILHPQQGQLDAAIKLARANVTFGEYRIPITNLDLTCQLKDQLLFVPSMKATGLKGTVEASGSMAMNENLDSSIKLKVAGVQLQNLLATRKEGEPPKLAGDLSGDVSANAPLKAVLAAANPARPRGPATLPAQWGSGTVEVANGKLVRIPIFQGLSETVSKALRIVTVGTVPNALQERAKVEFEMHGDRVWVEDFTYVGDLIAARGQGAVGLNKDLDLQVAAGPVQRVQALLGKQIGGLLAAVTDNLLSYRVTGTIGDPKFEPVIGGGTVQNVGRGVKRGADSVGEGIESLGRGVGEIGRGIGNMLTPGQKEEQQPPKSSQ